MYINVFTFYFTPFTQHEFLFVYVYRAVAARF